jgi:hypothetical protein
MKLIKTQDGYILEDAKNNTIGQTFGKFKGKKLSLKNCQEIERGYDLDELVENRYPEYSSDIMGFDISIDLSEAFKEGFQKALELMSDKKFSEEDMKSFARNYYREIRENTSNLLWNQLADKCLQEHIQSIQQNEWDVEIETQRKVVSRKVIGSNPKIKGSGDVIKSYETVPKLDSDGCLILKRINKNPL